MFSIQTKINFLLKQSSRPPIIEINFLGTGGSFDFEEKNSSAIIKTILGSILIDCGSTVYTELRTKNLIQTIDYVFITHCHEDHIGSLSTFIYHKNIVEKKVAKIECADSVAPIVYKYLVEICGHNESDFVINSINGLLYEDLNALIYKIDTSGFHFENCPSSGFVFNYKKSGEDIYVIFSGDVGVPILDVIMNNDIDLYNNLVKSRENTFIFHESTSYDNISCHCKFDELEKCIDIFPNIMLYHHGKKETDMAANSFKREKQKLEYIKKTIDIELNKKMSIVKRYELQENLRVQAKRMKEEFEEEFSGVTLKTKDLNNIGKEFVILEEGNV